MVDGGVQISKFLRIVKAADGWGSSQVRECLIPECLIPECQIPECQLAKCQLLKYHKIEILSTG